MGIPQLTTCCFCCSTETGSKIIGWLHTVFSALALLFGIFGLIAGFINYGNQEGKHKDDALVVIIVLLILVVIYAFTVTLGICLLVGIFKRRLSLIKLYVTVTTVLLCINVVLVIIYVILMFTGTGNLVELIKLIFSFALSSYFLLVVYSFYRDLKFGTNSMA